MNVVWAALSHGDRYRRLVESHGSPLLVLDAAVLRERYRSLRRHLPGVGIYYAVKSLAAPAVLRVLSREGAGFDLASAGEVALAQAIGVPPRRCIHTHPIKHDDEIRAGLRYGCTTFVVDNPFEIQKFVRYRHRVGLLLRVGFRNPEAKVDLAHKFGCDPAAVPELLMQAHRLGLHVKGLSFHVGSQCPSPTAHVAAIEACRDLLVDAVAYGAAPMSLLDIGGGFPVAYGGDDVANAQQLESFCAPVHRALATLPREVEVIAEPGRCLSAPAVELVTTVIGKAERGGRTWYYLDEGVYGAFSGQIYDGAVYPLTLFGTPTVKDAVLAGPTCDSIDVVRDGVQTPELGLGEVVVARYMGAYTAASATDFNGLKRAAWVVLNEEGSGSKPLRVASE